MDKEIQIHKSPEKYTVNSKLIIIKNLNTDLIFSLKNQKLLELTIQPTNPIEKESMILVT